MSRVLIIGFGSIGRRQFRHFRDLGCSPVEVFRTGKAAMPEDPSLVPDRVVHDFDEALAAKPEIVVVANPTSLHLETARAAVRAGCNVLVEKPLSHSMDGLDQLTAEVKRQGVVAGVAHNQRYHPLMRELREMIRGGKPLGTALLARAHLGGYLPGWHPWEDYKQSYAARRDLGGGASLTNIHELDYLLWLLGPAKLHSGVELGLHPLGTDVDEASAFLLGHDSGVISAVTLSLAQKPQSRTLDLMFTGGNAHLDLMAGGLELEFADGGSETHLPPEGWTLDHTYRDQAADFIAAVRGGRVGDFTTLDEAAAALRIVLDRKGVA